MLAGPYFLLGGRECISAMLNDIVLMVSNMHVNLTLGMFVADVHCFRA